MHLGSGNIRLERKGSSSVGADRTRMGKPVLSVSLSLEDKVCSALISGVFCTETKTNKSWYPVQASNHQQNPPHITASCHHEPQHILIGDSLALEQFSLPLSCEPTCYMYLRALMVLAIILPWPALLVRLSRPSFISSLHSRTAMLRDPDPDSVLS